MCRWLLKSLPLYEDSHYVYSVPVKFLQIFGFALNSNADSLLGVKHFNHIIRDHSTNYHFYTHHTHTVQRTSVQAVNTVNKAPYSMWEWRQIGIVHKKKMYVVCWSNVKSLASTDRNSAESKRIEKQWERMNGQYEQLRIRQLRTELNNVKCWQKHLMKKFNRIMMKKNKWKKNPKWKVNCNTNYYLFECYISNAYRKSITLVKHPTTMQRFVSYSISSPAIRNRKKFSITATLDEQQKLTW